MYMGRLSFEVQSGEYEVFARQLTALLGNVDTSNNNNNTANNNNKDDESNCRTHSSRRKSTVSFFQAGLSFESSKKICIVVVK
jgi:hypothetical protein